jgi:large subunit ribosomal protein L18
MALIIKRAKSKSAARGRRHLRVRKRVNGTSLRPRLVVSRSSRHVFVQIVDDSLGTTVASASTMEPDLRAFDGDKTRFAGQERRRRRGRLRPRRQPLPRTRRRAR